MALLTWDKAFDFLLYPAAIMTFGPLFGTALMMIASLVVCLILLMLYDRLGRGRFRDVLGFESLKEAGEGLLRSRLAQLASFAGASALRTAAKVGLFLCQSVWFGPMTCTIFMRSVGVYRMSRADWLLFGGSVLVSNLVWAALVYVGVESVRGLLGALG